MALEDPRDKSTRGQRSRSGGGTSGGGGGGGGKPKTKNPDSILSMAPKAPGPLSGLVPGSTPQSLKQKIKEAKKKSTQELKDTIKGNKSKKTSSNPLDMLLGYETEEDRIAAYQNNPNRPQYDTSTMGVPISEYGVTPTDLLTGQNLGMSKSASMAINGIAGTMSGIGPGLAATRAIQAFTGMSGGPSVGGFSDGKLSKSQSRINADKSAEGYQEEIAKKRKKAAQATLLGATTEDNGLGLDKFGKQVQYLE